MTEKQQNSLKKVITVLLLLLLINITALAVVKIYKNSQSEETQSFVAPDNIISPDKSEIETEETEDVQTDINTENSTVENLSKKQSVEKEETTVISLHKRNSGDNRQFNAGNMFPGDKISKYYCVRITHEGSVDVYFDADVRNGYEKLSEVLKCKITLVTTGEVLFDGLIKDVHATASSIDSYAKTTTDLYYQIDAYLDTSVGNEYMNKELVADFEWWIENEENLRTLPNTADITNTTLWINLLAVSAILLIFILIKRKRENADE